MAQTTLQPGDWAPHFNAPTNGSRHFAFASLGGRYVILSFLGTLQHKACAEVHNHIVARHQAWMDGGGTAAHLAVISNPADIQAQVAAPVIPGVRTVFDPELALSRLYGRVSEEGETRQYAAATFVLDPLLRVLAIIPVDARHNAALDAIIAKLPPPHMHTGVPVGAPVLVLPRVFEPEFCKRLIAEYETHGGEVSGFMREINGMTTLQRDDAFKRREDHVLTDAALQAEARRRIERRLIPGVRAAFQFTATRIERYLVARYDGESGGFFKGHRDNTTKGTAHRRFAVTINLNAEDYEGGDLRFPEFGPRTYRAPTGGAVVFSCSLLHEACPVTRGRRYAFLPFLFDEAGEALRLENLKYLVMEDGTPLTKVS